MTDWPHLTGKLVPNVVACLPLASMSAAEIERVKEVLVEIDRMEQRGLKAEALTREAQQDVANLDKQCSEIALNHGREIERLLVEIGMLNRMHFEKDIAEVINRHSKENGSDTPDFILAAYLANCLYAFNHAMGNDECGANHDDRCVMHFAQEMRDKLDEKRAEGKGSWEDPEACSVEDLARGMIEHLPKGDPVDIANYCMMIYMRGDQGNGGAISRAFAALGGKDGKR